MHTWEGIVRSVPDESRFNRETGEFYFPGVWANSYEAEQHLMFNGPASEPVCWTLMGYASGWCTTFFGRKVIAYESACAGKGDPQCYVIIQPEAEHGPEAAAVIEALKDF
jgi:hypothetical protein